MLSNRGLRAAGLFAALFVPLAAPAGAAQELPPREGAAAVFRQGAPLRLVQNDAYRPEGEGAHGADTGGAYRPDEGYRTEDLPPPGGGYEVEEGRRGRRSADADGGYGEPYGPPRGGDGGRYGREPPGSYSRNEILDAGSRFFGAISEGLARVVEHVFEQEGRPNGYILGEDAGGAFVAGLRYGRGVLYTKYDGDHPVYWQGPSVGYDFGGEGSKTMVLVYNLRSPSDIYHRFGGVQGSAYIVGGVGVQFQKYGDIILAPIRSGVGLRLGANVGYLKYTRHPTWNPF